MHREHVEAGREIQRRTGKTFYLATRFLPKRVRHPTHVLYGFFRIADEVVDDANGASPTAQRAELESLRAQALGEADPEGPVLTAFQEVKRRHGIDDREVNAFVDAMLADVTTSRYETVDDLAAYTRGSAAAVGVMMTRIMDPEMEDAAIPHAIKLGEAFQLTNFIRDVREDVLERDRIYLPREILDRHGASIEQVEALAYSESFGSAIAAELGRTEARYREGVAGIRYLPADCQLPVLLAAVLYAEHHALVRAREYDVLSARPSLSTARKLWCLAKTRWAWRWNRDPEAVFRRVSAVPSSEGGHRDPEPGSRVPVK